MSERCLCGQRTCHLSGPPGTIGSVLFGGDRSIAFWRDPLGFIENNAAQHGSRIFRTRLALKPTSCSCWSFLQQQRRTGWLWERPKRELLGAVRSQHHVCNGRRSSSAKVIVLYFIYFKHSFSFEIFLSFRQLILPLFGCNSANKFQSILQVSALEKHSIKMIFLFCFN